MINRDTHIEEELLRKANVSYRKSKEDAWKEISAVLDETPDAKVIPIYQNWRYLSIAASFAVLIAVFSFMRFNSINVACPSGQKMAVNLPDGSEVQLNAASELSYHPYWWRISRNIRFEGEAFFRVTPGSTFRVSSEKGITEVVGTSFNIFSRAQRYEVTCLSGKVRVRSVQSEVEALLMQYERAAITNGDFEITLVKDRNTEPSWIRNYISFTSVPLNEVFDEIERQFGIRIYRPENMAYIYTGNFRFGTEVESILSLICSPFNLEYEKQSEGKYTITDAAEN